MARVKILDKTVYENICGMIDKLKELVEKTKKDNENFLKLPLTKEDIAKKRIRKFRSPNIEEIQKLKKELTQCLKEEGLQKEKLVKEMNETINGYSYTHEYTETEVNEMIEGLKKDAEEVATTIGSDPDLISKP